MNCADEGVLHLIYAVHRSEADFRRIEADLNLIMTKNRPLILVFEDVVTIEYVRQQLNPSLRDLATEVLFDPDTVRRNRERLAIAYADAVEEMNGIYHVWNGLPAARRQAVFGRTLPFNDHLLAWAAAHVVEMIRGDTSFQAWLGFATWNVRARRTDAAAARGDAAIMWAEHRKEWEALARSIQLRDADVNAQITRIVSVERRWHDVLYVVGALHVVNETLLVDGLSAVVHERRIAEMITERFATTLMQNTFDDQPAESREQLQALAFLHERLQAIVRPTSSLDAVAALLEKTVEATAEQNVTLRQVVDHLITIPAFQEQARMLDPLTQRAYLAQIFIALMISSGFICRSDVEEYFYHYP